MLINGGKNWMEQAVKDQPLAVNRLPDVVKAVGLPDLYPGRILMGTAALNRGILYPHLPGNDIGRGMNLFDTGVGGKKFRQEKWISRLEAIRELEDIPLSSSYKEECPIRDLETLGGGNHLTEFQYVGWIYDQEAAGSLGSCVDRILLLIHCGSRGHGQRIPSRLWVPEGLADGSEQAEACMVEHDRALRWAVKSRGAAAQKLLAWLEGVSEPKFLVDSCHNYPEWTRDGLLHKKGSVSAPKGVVVISGPRGSLTYMCTPGENTAVPFNSFSHGTGRKRARNICKSRMDQRYDRDFTQYTGLKNRVTCRDTNLLFAEVPEAYRNVEQVVGALQKYGLINIVATLCSLIVFKE